MQKLETVKPIFSKITPILRFGVEGIVTKFPTPFIAFKGNDSYGFKVLSKVFENKLKPHELRRYYKPINGVLKAFEWDITFIDFT